jgi:hypothetical protein
MIHQGMGLLNKHIRGESAFTAQNAVETVNGFAPTPMIPTSLQIFLQENDTIKMTSTLKGGD